MSGVIRLSVDEVSHGLGLCKIKSPVQKCAFRKFPRLGQSGAVDVVSIDGDVASAWADLRLRLRDSRRKMPVNDSGIAATAISLGIPVVTQDTDYLDVPGLDVILV